MEASRPWEPEGDRVRLATPVSKRGLILADAGEYAILDADEVNTTGREDGWTPRVVIRPVDGGYPISFKLRKTDRVFDAAEDIGDYPIPDDPRPLRDQVTDHPFLGVLVYLNRGSLVPEHWRYDYLDTDEGAGLWLEDVTAWALGDVERFGRSRSHDYVVVLTKSVGYPLEIVGANAVGCSDDDAATLVATIAKKPESILFAKQSMPATVPTATTKPGAVKAPRKKGAAKPAEVPVERPAPVTVETPRKVKAKPVKGTVKAEATTPVGRAAAIRKAKKKAAATEVAS